MSRIVSFCFDDGFRRSAGKIRAMFEARKLRACFAVLAAPELAADPFIHGAAIADWSFWREAQAAGHEVAPHGYAHERLGDMPLAEAIRSIEATFKAFAAELPGFEAGEAVFHLAHLAAPPEVVDWLRPRSLGVRMARGGLGINAPAGIRAGGLIDCVTFAPDAAEEKLAARLDRFLADEAGWLVLVLHGLDGEGWGTVPAPRLEAVLDRLLDAGVEIAPPGAVIRRLAASAAGGQP